MKTLLILIGFLIAIQTHSQDYFEPFFEIQDSVNIEIVFHEKIMNIDFGDGSNFNHEEDIYVEDTIHWGYIIESGLIEYRIQHTYSDTGVFNNIIYTATDTFDFNIDTRKNIDIDISYDNNGVDETSTPYLSYNLFYETNIDSVLGVYEIQNGFRKSYDSIVSLVNTNDSVEIGIMIKCIIDSSICYIVKRKYQTINPLYVCNLDTCLGGVECSIDSAHIILIDSSYIETIYVYDFITENGDTINENNYSYELYGAIEDSIIIETFFFEYVDVEWVLYDDENDTLIINYVKTFLNDSCCIFELCLIDTCDVGKSVGDDLRWSEEIQLDSLGEYSADYTTEITNTETIEVVKNDYSVYPNPTTNYINIDGENINKIKIYDLSGRCLIETSNKTIDLSHLRNNLYIMLIEIGDEKIYKKIIKK